MSQRKMEGLRIIADSYQVIKPLFQVRSYLYAQVCCLNNNHQIVNAALYVYENEDPSQSLKMLSEKLDIHDHSEFGNLIFPYEHIKDSLNQKHISLFLVQDFIIPLRYYQKTAFSIEQILQILHGALNCLNLLHIRDIVHGNISLSTCYLVRQKKDHSCKFALNILDTAYFTEQDCFEGIEERLFQSEGQSLGLKMSFKDDLQSLVYVMTHLLSKGKLFTTQRFQLQWVTQAEYLRWKSCDFFKEIIQLIPPQLQILIQIYMIAKSLRRNQKPDYLKLMKKVLGIIAAQAEKKQAKKRYKTNATGKNLSLTKKQSNQSVNRSDIVIKLQNIKGKVQINRRSRDQVKQNNIA